MSIGLPLWPFWLTSILALAVRTVIKAHEVADCYNCFWKAGNSSICLVATDSLPPCSVRRKYDIV